MPHSARVSGSSGTQAERAGDLDVVPQARTATPAGLASGAVAGCADGARRAGRRFRAWALYPSWFYLDDYSLLLEASREDTAAVAGLPGRALERPPDARRPPAGLGGRAVRQPRLGRWRPRSRWRCSCSPVAALWMLVTLFGRRWAILAPAVRSTSASAMTVPGADVVDGLAQPAAPAGRASSSPSAPGCATCAATARRWLRRSRMLGVAFGLLLLRQDRAGLPGAGLPGGRLLRRPAVRCAAGPRRAAPLLARRAGHGRRAGGGLRRLLLRPTSTRAVPGTERRPGRRIADTMLGTAFATAAGRRTVAVEGDRSRRTPSPTRPAWTVHLAWVVVAAPSLVARADAARAPAAPGCCSRATSPVLLALLRHQPGARSTADLIGLEYRYLTDAACAVALCVGLAFLTLRGAPGSSSAPRATRC